MHELRVAIRRLHCDRDACGAIVQLGRVVLPGLNVKCDWLPKQTRRMNRIHDETSLDAQPAIEPSRYTAELAVKVSRELLGFRVRLTHFCCLPGISTFGYTNSCTLLAGSTLDAIIRRQEA